jgi:hypothetical protein
MVPTGQSAYTPDGLRQNENKTDDYLCHGQIQPGQHKGFRITLALPLSSGPYLPVAQYNEFLAGQSF